LSSDAKQVETWTKEQPDPSAEFKKFTFDEMKSALEKWLAPETDEEGAIISEPNDDFDETAQPAQSKFSLDTTKAKQTKTDKFDSLFDEDKSNEPNDLPF